MKTTHNEAEEEEFKRELKVINPDIGLSQMASKRGITTDHNGYKETRFGVSSWFFFIIPSCTF